jgi:hypothetical protein
MKNIARNTLAYVGTITLSQYVGAKKVVIGQIHNDGNTPLFDFFASCLMGDFATAKTLLPRKIGLFTATLGANNSLENVRGIGKWGLLSSAKKVVSTESTSAVRYSFSIPFEIISPITSFADAYVGLYTENEESYEDYLARFSLATLNRSIFLNAALVVDWELQVVNNGTTYGNVSPTK